MKSIKALLAGVMIAFCGYGCLSIENKYISAFLFSFGLLTIISKGYELFTGKVYSLKILSL
jgi:nitrite transporter NirC